MHAPTAIKLRIARLRERLIYEARLAHLRERLTQATRRIETEIEIEKLVAGEDKGPATRSPSSLARPYPGLPRRRPAPS